MKRLLSLVWEALTPAERYKAAVVLGVLLLGLVARFVHTLRAPAEPPTAEASSPRRTSND